MGFHRLQVCSTLLSDLGVIVKFGVSVTILLYSCIMALKSLKFVVSSVICFSVILNAYAIIMKKQFAEKD